MVYDGNFRGSQYNIQNRIADGMCFGIKFAISW